jgi:hypothetical protein
MMKSATVNVGDTAEYRDLGRRPRLTLVRRFRRALAERAMPVQGRVSRAKSSAIAELDSP